MMLSDTLFDQIQQACLLMAGIATHFMTPALHEITVALFQLESSNPRVIHPLVKLVETFHVELVQMLSKESEARNPPRPGGFLFRTLLAMTRMFLETMTLSGTFQMLAFGRSVTWFPSTNIWSMQSSAFTVRTVTKIRQCHVLVRRAESAQIS